MSGVAVVDRSSLLPNTTARQKCHLLCPKCPGEIEDDAVMNEAGSRVCALD